jgi:hypothetical protein
VARRKIEEPSIWSEVSADPAAPRSRWTLVGLAVMAMALGLTFLIRGICWEALVISALIMMAVAGIARFRNVVLTVAVVVFLILGLIVVEGVNVYKYHSVLFTRTPRIVLWCGQEMAPQGAPVLARSDSDFERLAHGGPVRTVGVTPEGSAIVAAGSNAEWGCQWQLYVALGNDRWQYYSQDPGV